MTSKDSATAHPRRSVLDGVFAGCVFALSVGCLDIIASMLRIPAGFHSFYFVLPPLAATTLAAAVAFVIIALVFTVAQGILRLKVGAYLPAFLVFVALLFALAGLADLLPPSVLGVNVSVGDCLFKAGLLALLALPAAIGVHLALCSKAGSTRIVSALAAALPFLLAEALVFVWFEKYRLAFFSKASFVAIAACAAAFLLTLLFFHAAGRAAWAKGLAFVLFLAVLVSPAATVKHVTDTYHSTGLSLASSSDHAVPRVILIVVDTLRADALTCYGGGNATATPNIDSLARESVLFRHAVSPGPWTVPAMASIVTGVSPLAHGMNAFGARLPDTFKTIAEHMNEAGYVTAGIGDNGNLKAGLNFNQGFAYYNWYPRHEFGPISCGSTLLGILLSDRFRAEATTEILTGLALEWTAGNQQNDFFMHLHFYDPHMPYTPPPEFAPDGTPPAGFERGFSKDEAHRAMTGKLARSTEERAWVRELYNGEVRLVDAHVGRFMKTLKAQGLYDDALIILTSDHGEEFWEHGDFEHGQSLYGELLNVPLIVKLPGSTESRIVEAAVSTQSILPTILDLCGLPWDEGHFPPPSLGALCRSEGGAFAEASVVSAGLMRGDEREAVTGTRFKYIQSLVTSREELYDLTDDPGEQNDIARTSPGPAESERAALEDKRSEAGVIRKALGLSAESGGATLDSTTEETLRSMGYL